MKNLARRMGEIFVEIALAEEREIHYSKSVTGRVTEWIDNHFTAIIFAEAGEYDTARHVIGGGSGDSCHGVSTACAAFCASRA